LVDTQGKILNIFSLFLQIAKNYIKALNEMIRQTDAASGIFHDVQSPEQQRQQLQQQQDMQFCF
jgi:hypothetical protein